MNKVSLYYVISFFWALATSLGSVVGAGMFASGYTEAVHAGGAAGHPTPLAFFLPLLGFVFLGGVTFLIFDIVYAFAVLSPETGRFKHAAGNLLFYILATVAVPVILAAMSSMI